MCVCSEMAEGMGLGQARLQEDRLRFGFTSCMSGLVDSVAYRNLREESEEDGQNLFTYSPTTLVRCGIITG